MNVSVILQAGAFGEHHITDVTSSAHNSPANVDGAHFQVALPPGRTITLTCNLMRYSHTPTYKQPV